MVVIRLFRVGTHKRPQYRIVAMDNRRPRQGRYLESLGSYDPRGGEAARIDQAGIDRWVARGAQLSDTVRSLLRRQRRAEASAAPAEVSAPAES